MAKDTRAAAIEWHEANLARERLAVMEAACGSEQAASRNSLVIELGKKIGLIEKIVRANVPPSREKP